jgi:hypothetical protein
MDERLVLYTFNGGHADAVTEPRLLTMRSDESTSGLVSTLTQNNGRSDSQPSKARPGTSDFDVARP